MSVESARSADRRGMDEAEQAQSELAPEVLAMVPDAGPVAIEDVTAAPEQGPPKKKRASGVPVPRWTPEEEEQLREAVRELGEKAWPQVAERLGTGRSATGIDQHW